jgi:vacuolar protein sorting-associated protein 18
MPGNLGFSKLDFYYPNIRDFEKERNLSLPKTFAWLTGKSQLVTLNLCPIRLKCVLSHYYFYINLEPGVFYGQIDTSDSSLSTVTAETCLIAYDKENEESAISIKEKPLSMVLTQFHVLLLFKSKLKVICVLNEQVVLEDHFTEAYGNLIGIVKDAIKGTIIVFSEMAVYRYKVNNEDRNIWRIYLEKGDFNSAKMFAKTDPAKLDKVICDEAQHYFNNKKLVEIYLFYLFYHFRLILIISQLVSLLSVIPKVHLYML